MRAILDGRVIMFFLVATTLPVQTKPLPVRAKLNFKNMVIFILQPEKNRSPPYSDYNCYNNYNDYNNYNRNIGKKSKTFFCDSAFFHQFMLWQAIAELSTQENGLSC